jgi:hypothetical protein
LEENNETLKISIKDLEKEISRLEKVKTGDEIYLNKAIHKLKSENGSIRENIEEGKYYKLKYKKLILKINF